MLHAIFSFSENVAKKLTKFKHDLYAAKWKHCQFFLTETVKLKLPIANDLLCAHIFLFSFISIFLQVFLTYYKEKCQTLLCCQTLKYLDKVFMPNIKWQLSHFRAFGKNYKKNLTLATLNSFSRRHVAVLAFAFLFVFVCFANHYTNAKTAWNCWILTQNFYLNFI